jgi:hypothetical protein
MIRVFGIADALHSLCPGATWKYSDEDFSTIEWLSDDCEQPSESDVLAEVERLQNEYDLAQAEIARQESEKELAKQSALLKLEKFGLTLDEAKAVIGI